jgi:hypothetical protein
VAQAYLGAMRAAINCALANRQILTHLVRETFARHFPEADLRLLYDVSHNTCKVERHAVNGDEKPLFVHRKGATRAFGPGHPDLPASLAVVGQPVLIGGTMGAASYVLVGTSENASAALDTTFLLPFAAGNFIYIAASDLIPEVKHEASLARNLVHFSAFAVGLLLILATRYAFEV